MAVEETQFKPGQSGNPNGRPKGARNRISKERARLLGPILPEAIEQLHKAVRNGEKWAIEMTVSYSLPKPKPVDTEEMAEFEERLQELEKLVERTSLVNANMKARLDRIGQRLGSDGRPVVVFQRVGETDQDVEDKLRRWKAGESVEDVKSQFPYAGGEPLIIRIVKFCPSSKRAA